MNDLRIAQLLSLENMHVDVMLLKAEYEVSLLRKEKQLAGSRLSAACAKCNISEQDPQLCIMPAPCRCPFPRHPRSIHSTPTCSTRSTCSIRSTLSTLSTHSPYISSDCSDCSDDSSEACSSSSSLRSLKPPKSLDYHATASTSKKERKRRRLSELSLPQSQKRMRG